MSKIRYKLYKITHKINKFIYKLKAKFWIKFIEVGEINYNPTDFSTSIDNIEMFLNYLVVGNYNRLKQASEGNEWTNNNTLPKRYYKKIKEAKSLLEDVSFCKEIYQMIKESGEECHRD